MADLRLRLCSTLAGCTERLRNSIPTLLFNPASALAIVLVTPLVTQLNLVVQTDVATCATDCATRTAMKVLIRLEGGRPTQCAPLLWCSTRVSPPMISHRPDLRIQLPTLHNPRVLKWVLSFRIDLSAATCVEGAGSTAVCAARRHGRVTKIEGLGLRRRLLAVKAVVQN
jgi:hypothetical protein